MALKGACESESALTMAEELDEAKRTDGKARSSAVGGMSMGEAKGSLANGSMIDAFLAFTFGSSLVVAEGTTEIL